jgi:hypothetical protein
VIEVHCDEYTIPVGGKAIVSLEDGLPHEIDVWEDQITVWNAGQEQAEVELIAPKMPEAAGTL